MAICAEPTRMAEPPSKTSTDGHGASKKASDRDGATLTRGGAAPGERRQARGRKGHAYDAVVHGRSPSRPCALRQAVECLREAAEGDRNADALLRRLKNDEGRRPARLELVDERILQHDLGDAAGGEAAHESGA